MNCYAADNTPARVARAAGHETWGESGERIHVAGFAKKVQRLNKLCICDRCHETAPVARITENGFAGVGCVLCNGPLRRIRFFPNSNSDWLDLKWPVETFAQFLDLIRLTPNVDWQCLTKRPDNWRKRMRDAVLHADQNGSPLVAKFADAWTDGKAPPNVWFGVSVEDQARADQRIPALLFIPAAVRWLSCEPLLEMVHLGQVPEQAGDVFVDWLVVGCESGPDRRFQAGYYTAAKSLLAQCAMLDLPAYHKQMPLGPAHRVSHDPAEWPAPFQVRQFPGQPSEKP